MSDLTPKTLAELRRLLDEATPGPWHAWDRGIGYEVHTEVEHNPIRCDPLNSGFRETFGGPDAQLIVAAVNALPALLDAAAERDALAEAVERVRALPVGPPSGGFYMISMRDVRQALAEDNAAQVVTPNPYRTEGEPR